MGVKGKADGVGGAPGDMGFDNVGAVSDRYGVWGTPGDMDPDSSASAEMICVRT